jgi:predicted amidophosphoribosyltransferase
LKRGYNQAYLLAERVASMLSLPVDSTLKRTLFSSTQHKRGSAEERFENAYDSYKMKKAVKGRVLLIDDIKTTGASLEACSRELLKAGADEVYCLTALVGNKN